MKRFENISPQLKSSFMKMLGLLVLIIFIFTLLSRILFSGGETLAEYAERNTTEENIDTAGETLPPAETAPEATPSAKELSTAEPSASVSPSVEELSAVTPSASVSPMRVTYEESFYYEPLSEDLIAYITGISYPAEGTDEISYEDLVYVHILYVDFEGSSTEGELLCNKAIAQDLVEIFYELYVTEYRIGKVSLIENYEGDDTASMLDNNTSCFNFRPVEGTDRLSRHAYGLAIDINPFYNPYVTYTNDGGQKVSPEGSEVYADRSQSFPYKIDTSDLCYRLFTEHGFIWGGNWNSCKDYQHFQKVID